MIRSNARLYVLLFVTYFFLDSCAIFQGPNLAKRYKNKSDAETFDLIKGNAQTFVTVGLNSTYIISPNKTDVKFNLLSLSERGQQAYVSAAAAKSGTLNEFMQIINSNFEFIQKPKSKTRIIPKNIKKSLIFTIDRKHYNKTSTGSVLYNVIGDRVAFLELILNISSGHPAKFSSWDKYVSDKVTLSLGNITSAQNWNASLNIGAKGTGQFINSSGSLSEDSFNDANAILLNQKSNSENSGSYEITTTEKNSDSIGNTVTKNTELGGSAEIGYGSKVETSLPLSSRILQLSGSLSSHQIILRQESGPGIDLSGNIVVSIEYVLEDDWAPPQQLTKLSKIYLPSGKPQQLSNIEHDHVLLLFPDIQADINGTLDYSFLYRQISSGSKHIPEARQKVVYKFGEVLSANNSLLFGGTVPLIEKEDIRPKVFMIEHSSPGSVTPDYLTLKDKKLVFESINEATTCLSYIFDLANESMAIDGFKLNSSSITNSDIKNLRIVTIQL